MTTGEVHTPQLAELGGLLEESVLLSQQTKIVLREYIKTAWDKEALLELHQILSEQKAFIVSYLKEGLHSNSLKSDTSMLMHEMRIEYQKKLQTEEDKLRHFEILAMMKIFETSFPL